MSDSTGSYVLLTHGTTAGTTPEPLLVATLWVCSECERASLAEYWTRAWHAELQRRQGDPEYQDPDEEWPASQWGLDDRMVCPRCKRVHSDDESSFVDEHLIEIVPPAFGDSLT